MALWLGLISSVCLLGVAAVPVNYWTELHTFFSQLSFLCASVACLLFCIAAAQVDLLPRSAFIGVRAFPRSFTTAIIPLQLLLLTGGSVVLLLSYFITNGYMPGVSLKWPFCVCPFTVVYHCMFPLWSVVHQRAVLHSCHVFRHPYVLWTINSPRHSHSRFRPNVSSTW